MSDKNNIQDQAAPSYGILHQYLKDLSFEVTGHNFMDSGDKTASLDVNVDIKTQTLKDDVYEVILHLSVTSKVEETALFIVEADYAAIVHALNLPKENVKELLFIEIPHMIFPFVRQIISTTTQNGGFPPVLLGSIDFIHLYQQNYQAH